MYSILHDAALIKAYKQGKKEEIFDYNSQMMELSIEAKTFSLRCYIFIYDDFLLSAQKRCRLTSIQYDIEKGLLLKLDSFLQIQLGSVYRGLSKVPDEVCVKGNCPDLELVKRWTFSTGGAESLPKPNHSNCLRRGGERKCKALCTLSTLPNGFTCRFNPFRAVREK